MKIEMVEVLARRPDGPLYHYTNQGGLLGIVRSREIWATHMRYLNDSREYLYAMEMIRAELGLLCRGEEAVRNPLAAPAKGVDNNLDFEAMSDLLSSEERNEGTDVFVASFSEVRDSLSQWRAYAPHGGFCMGFEWDDLMRLGSPGDFRLLRCLYERDRQLELVRALIGDAMEGNMLSSGLDHEQDRRHRVLKLLVHLWTYGPLLKHPSFAEEREWRVVCGPVNQPELEFREGSSTLLPYCRIPLHRGDEPMPLDEVVVGPTPDPERSKAAVKRFLVRNNLQKTKVTCSEVPYRNW